METPQKDNQETPKQEVKIEHKQHKPSRKLQQPVKVRDGRGWYDKYYKYLMLIPVSLVIISMVYLSMFYGRTGDFINRDVSLKGGTTITLVGNVDSARLEAELPGKVAEVSFRSLSDLRTGENIALAIESSQSPEELKAAIEGVLGYELTEENSSTEFTGPTLSANFYRQLVIALLISFILMSCVIFFMFKTFIPSTAVIFAAFSNIVIALAIIDYFGVKLSAAGIAAFLMIIGYSVDTDILLTTRALKKTEGTLNQRIFGAFKTGGFMTATALFAVLPAFFIVTGLPDSFRQIFLILALGLGADLFNTWLTNAGIIKWYCEKKGIQ
ncbi:MAG: protein translocase subunit SecF [archaeon]|jgi:preprotein translocase subunit SecF|nr:protein translocase subunit SecF [archaeon]